MEEFKNVQWDILIDDLQLMGRDELINCVIIKQNEIETLKFEVSKLNSTHSLIDIPDIRVLE